MSLDARPASEVFDPAAGELPAALDRAVSGGAPIVLLVVGAEARESGWAAHAAVAAADAAAQRRRVILADLSFEEPQLHGVLGMRNREGLADVFLFGASLDRVAQRASNHAFQLVPPGAYVPDAQEILSSSRWMRLVPELGELGTVLLAYVPADAAGLSDLVRHGTVVVLEADGDDVEGRLPDDCVVAVTVLPPGSAGSGASGSDAAEGGEPENGQKAEAVADAGAPNMVEARDAPQPAGAAEPPYPGEPPGAGEPVSDGPLEAGDLPGGGGAAGPVAPDAAASPEVWVDEVPVSPSEAVVPGSPVDELTIPPVLRPRGESRRRVSPVLWVLLAVAVAAAAWYAYTEYVAPARRAATAPVQQAAPPDPGRPIETEVPVSVSIEVYENLDVAQRRVAALRAAEPDLEFFVSPVLNDGVTYERVMAGPVADVDAGMALMRRLVQDGYKTAEEPWSVRPTALAFRIQEFDTREAALARRDQLAARGVPTYVVEVPYTVGPPHYRLYAGAYEYRSEAQVMAQLLQSAGIDAPLVPRTGRPVA